MKNATSGAGRTLGEALDSVQDGGKRDDRD